MGEDLHFWSFMVACPARHAVEIELRNSDLKFHISDKTNVNI